MLVIPTLLPTLSLKTNSPPCLTSLCPRGWTTQTVRPHSPDTGFQLSWPSGKHEEETEGWWLGSWCLDPLLLLHHHSENGCDPPCLNLLWGGPPPWLQLSLDLETPVVFHCPFHSHVGNNFLRFKVPESLTIPFWFTPRWITPLKMSLSVTIWMEFFFLLGTRLHREWNGLWRPYLHSFTLWGSPLNTCKYREGHRAHSSKHGI